VSPPAPARELDRSPPSRSPRWLTPSELEDLELRFRAFAKESAVFRDDIHGRTGLGGSDRPSLSARANLEIARTVFSKWSLEVMVVLYAHREIGFAELRRKLDGISARVLSQRLKALEELGFVQRTIVGSRPPRVIYVLTYEGHTVSRLGEPLFLYLHLRRTYRQRGVATRRAAATPAEDGGRARGPLPGPSTKLAQLAD
jgi:DNA-binding HxlR family transcriptional regulator